MTIRHSCELVAEEMVGRGPSFVPTSPLSLQRDIEAKTCHELSRAIRRGLINMKIQAYLTAAAVNLKQLASAFLSILLFVYSQEATSSARHSLRQGKVFGIGLLVASA